MNNLLPANPQHKEVAEVDGIKYQYDILTRSWIEMIGANNAVAVATQYNNGVMSSIDYKKLNRLILSPPISTIIGNDCVTPFTSGTIGLYSADEFINVNGYVSNQNVDSNGDNISQIVPFQINSNTYAFDFTINLSKLITELERREQFNVIGPQGDTGDTGDAGDTGIDYIASGPPGTTGINGDAPPCDLTIEADSIVVEPIANLNKALVDVRVVPDTTDQSKFRLEFDRQAIGLSDYAADKLNITNGNSSWILAITGGESKSTTMNCDDQNSDSYRSAQLYYIDVEPIISAIHNRYITEATILRNGYKNIVKYWVQTMSDLFDEQKTALCNALEHAISITKNIDARQHMENVAASAAGSANIMINNRNSNEVTTVSSTGLLPQINAGPNVCNNGNIFPAYPSLDTNGVGGFGDTAASAQVVKSQIKPNNLYVIDSILNSNIKNSVQTDLDSGEYVATIKNTNANSNKLFKANVKIQYNRDGSKKIIRFMDKGEYDNQDESQQAYNGLTLSFKHSGGFVSIWAPSTTETVSGTTTLEINKINEYNKIIQEKPQIAKAITPNNSCTMSIEHLKWYEKSWNSGTCCGLVVNVIGQDYIVIKKSIGNDLECGGGETFDTPCIAKFKDIGHPAFAWPTFDKKTFVPIPNTNEMLFQYDSKLNDIITSKISNGEFENGKGNPASVQFLANQLSPILFPITI